jgi:hypothetical protein
MRKFALESFDINTLEDARGKVFRRNDICPARTGVEPTPATYCGLSLSVRKGRMGRPSAFSIEVIGLAAQA